MPRKLFIVGRGREQLFRTLWNVLAKEAQVEIIYDRRAGTRLELRPAQERRIPSDVDERIGAAGYAIVRPSDVSHSAGNIRWSA